MTTRIFSEKYIEFSHLFWNPRKWITYLSEFNFFSYFELNLCGSLIYYASSPEWPWTHSNPSTSIWDVLGLQACTTMPELPLPALVQPQVSFIWQHINSPCLSYTCFECDSLHDAYVHTTLTVEVLPFIHIALIIL